MSGVTQLETLRIVFQLLNVAGFGLINLTFQIFPKKLMNKIINMKINEYIFFSKIEIWKNKWGFLFENSKLPPPPPRSPVRGVERMANFASLK